MGQFCFKESCHYFRVESARLGRSNSRSSNGHGTCRRCCARGRCTLHESWRPQSADNPRSSNGQRDFLPVRTCRDNLRSQQLKDPRRFCLPWIQAPRRCSSIVYSWVSVMKAMIAEAALPKQIRHREASNFSRKPHRNAVSLPPH